MLEIQPKRKSVINLMTVDLGAFETEGVYIAKAVGASIIPISWHCDSCWTLNTWDKMKIPKPFSSISIIFGEPVRLEPGKNLPSIAEIQAAEEKLSEIGT